MLNLYRRHRANCKSHARRAKCFCPIWVQGILRGNSIRKSLDLTNWEAANKLIRDWEIDGPEVVVSVSDATARWIADCEARNMKPASIRKYKEIRRELDARFASLRVVSVDDVRKMRESWKDKYSGGTMAKRLELVRAFFSFCLESDWIEKNPAKGVKAPPVKRAYVARMGFSQLADFLALPFGLFSRKIKA
jgi:hypothetical protein